jgi:hypothetical protein
MYPGRHPGSRTLQGLTIKAHLEKLGAGAERHREWHAQSAGAAGRVKTIQNLAITIVITMASTLTLLLALDGLPIEGTAVWLAVAAPVSTSILIVRRHPERQAAHGHSANRYALIAASCRHSISRYEANAIGDGEFQALLDQLVWDLETLRGRGE